MCFRNENYGVGSFKTEWRYKGNRYNDPRAKQGLMQLPGVLFASSAAAGFFVTLCCPKEKLQEVIVCKWISNISGKTSVKNGFIDLSDEAVEYTVLR